MADYPQKRLPDPGEMVDVEYIDIDEIEVTCSITHYGCIGYLSNAKMDVQPSHIFDKDILKVSRVDPDGTIILVKAPYFVD